MITYNGTALTAGHKLALSTGGLVEVRGAGTNAWDVYTTATAADGGSIASWARTANNAYGTSTAQQGALAYPNSLAANSTLHVVANWYGSATYPTITCSSGNCTTLAATVKTYGGSQGYAEWVVGNTKGSSAETITVNWGSGSSYTGVGIEEYIGSTSGSVVDVNTGAPSSQIPSSGTQTVSASAMTTTVNNDLILCGMVTSNANPTGNAAGTGFTIGRNDYSGSAAVMTEYMSQSAAGSVTGSFSMTGAGGVIAYVGCIAVKH